MVSIDGEKEAENLHSQFAKAAVHTVSWENCE
jgi:hypothetical protein